ncbi:hypothetical protein [Yoonia sp.]|jgi:hypothetical protein|uniref:hypothetical protein n=1 Tax=Yoonia sp. TaxID=2212373 RepID=UPI0025F482C8|nr:hypothetical protein [Yoonia sp.]
MRSFFTAAKYLVIVVLLVVVARLVLTHNEDQKKILVVHSYNNDLAWVNDVDEGVRRAIEDAAGRRGPSLNVRTHYMNLRNHPDCNFYKNATSDVRFTIGDWQPEVLILIDDLAQGLVGFNQVRLNEGADRARMAGDLNAWLAGDRCQTPDISFFGLDQPVTDNFPEVVFAGVNGGVGLYGYDQATNVSGIFERKNYQALIETLEALDRAYDGPVDGIMMLNDASPTGVTENGNYLLQDWAPFVAHPPVGASDFADWTRAVEEANAGNLMLLIANYQNVRDGQGGTVDPETLVQWTERNAKLPILGANTRFVADGGMMTVAIAGSEQGQVAMELAIAAIDGNPDRPHYDAKQFLIGMNQSLVRKRNLQLPSIYEAFSREIGTFIEAMEQLYVVQSGENQ